ncbi:MAG: hypothetical protein KC645_06970 [Gemmatimonadetes bacterium]|nr:hypothetical protein [Gemmatimonadota bacterium]
MRYRIVIRHGRPRQRYHTLEVDAADLAAALVAAAQRLPPDLVATADLAEVREAPDPEGRAYLEEPSP